MLDRVDAPSLRSRVIARAVTDPERPALVVKGVTLCYRQLVGCARKMAAALTCGGSRRLERVGILAQRSEAAYVGTLAALCSGAAFVPLNPRYPLARTRVMVRRAKLDAIIVDAAGASELRELLLPEMGQTRILAPDLNVASSLANQGLEVIGPDQMIDLPPLEALPDVVPEDIAYLLFTSGTTGEPKGVGITHANVLHFLGVVESRYRISREDRCSQTFDQTFDLSVFDLFVTWSAGACLYAMDPLELLAPVRFITKHALTVWFSVPSVAALCIKRKSLPPGSLPSLRHSLFCGEPLPDATASQWQQAAQNSSIENLYGPTELTIACFSHTWQASPPAVPTQSGFVPIGRPFPGLGAMVVDENLEPVSKGDAGELLVCGPQTAPGYWENPKKTAEGFVEVAISSSEMRRFYRTGDRVRRTSSGEYVFLGRNDHQIKVLGFRVELADVEGALLRHHGVVQAVAIGWPLEDGRATGIVAFATGSDLVPEAIVRTAAELLPDYMVPGRILILEAMPLNANGKIDRVALAAQVGLT